MLPVVERAVQLHNQGVTAESERLCLEVLELAPGQLDALSVLYQIRKAAGQHGAADALLRRIVALHPNTFWATNDLALALMARGAILEAEIHARNAVRIAPENPQAHYLTTGPEIWEDSQGKITHFVCGMGTGGTISGVGKYLKEKNPAVKIIGVDPYGSLYYDFVKSGETVKAKTYVVEGIGEDFFPTTMNLKILDDVVQVNDEECFVAARRLVKLEGLFTGGSGGGCISATLRLAKDLGPEAFVVAFLPDTGMRYLSKVYNDEWMRERGYAETAVQMTAAEVVNAKHNSGKVRELVIARPYQTVFHALKTMQEQDISQIPVFEENIPIGTIYEDQILTMALQGKDLRKLVVREVMSKPLPRVPASSPVERVTYILSHENPAVFVEMDGAKFEILTKYDLMSTVASLMEQKR